MVKQTKLQKKNILLLFGVVGLIIVGIFHRQLSSLFGLFYGVTIDKAIRLTNQNDSFNVALLGIAGGKHDGPDLSDTIIVANINLKQNKVHMFSIPRDLWVEGEDDKINALYAKEKKDGNGLGAVSGLLERITGLRIDYILVLDFEGFVRLVDHLGGVEVQVTNTLDDYHYPIEGLEDETCGKSEEDINVFTATASAESDFWDYFPCRYKHLHVDKGLIHMDGQLALEFVRSRHGVGSEGGDFARSKRQQQVISALRDKAFSLGVILNPVKLIGVYNILSENIATNIDIEKIDDFIKLADKLKDGEIKNYVFEEQTVDDPGLLVHPGISEVYRYKWVLIPRVGNGDYSEIQGYIGCVTKNNNCVIEKNGISTPTPSKDSN
jgi:LCP family protein required for cell wall assembly